MADWGPPLYCWDGLTGALVRLHECDLRLTEPGGDVRARRLTWTVRPREIAAYGEVVYVLYAPWAHEGSIGHVDMRRSVLERAPAEWGRRVDTRFERCVSCEGARRSALHAGPGGPSLQRRVTQEVPGIPRYVPFRTLGAGEFGALHGEHGRIAFLESEPERQRLRCVPRERLEEARGMHGWDGVPGEVRLELRLGADAVALAAQRSKALGGGVVFSAGGAAPRDSRLVNYAGFWAAEVDMRRGRVLWEHADANSGVFGETRIDRAGAPSNRLLVRVEGGFSIVYYRGQIARVAKGGVLPHPRLPLVFRECDERVVRFPAPGLRRRLLRALL